MNKTIRVRGNFDYYSEREPQYPKNNDIVVYEDGHFIRAYIYIKEYKEWFDVIDVKQDEDDNEYVIVIYSDNNELPEDIESMEYLYRTGAVL